MTREKEWQQNVSDMQPNGVKSRQLTYRVVCFNLPPHKTERFLKDVELSCDYQRSGYTVAIDVFFYLYAVAFLNKQLSPRKQLYELQAHANIPQSYHE